VQILNTPGNSIAVGATIIITWTYTPQVNPIPGILSIIDNTTKNTVIISSTINLSSQSYQWKVNVPAGTYFLGLNDGSGDKYSGTFTVFQSGLPNPATTQALFSQSAQLTIHSPAKTDEVVPSTPNPTTKANVNQTTTNSSNIGIYIGIAISGIIIGVVLSFVGSYVYKKYQDSRFIPTSGNVDHMDSMPGNVGLSWV
ncbi:3726_t:CDS:1, partial [Racocetra fulgida]